MRHRPILIWLAALATLVLAMVFVGGLTRMTGSGLSMVGWQPISGVIPPISHEDWVREFTAYQASPQFKRVNFWMELADFKRIFYWEYGHRVLGRLVGLVFIFPFIFFAVSKLLPQGYFGRFLLAFILGGCQGLLGWYMVKSGLVDQPHVSHLRLAAHLSLALFLFCYLFWLGLSLSGSRKYSGGRLTIVLARTLLVVVSLQIVYGAFAAGLNAGLVYNTFPLMNGYIVPPGVMALKPELINLFNNPVTVQWIHRGGAGLIFIAALLLAICLCLRSGLSPRSLKPLRYSSLLLLMLVGAQAALGVFVLLWRVPIALASAHQMGACAILGVTLFINYKIGSARA